MDAFTKQIKQTIDSHLSAAGVGTSPEFSYGEYIGKPGKIGVFQVKGQWFVFDNRQNNPYPIIGPFQRADIFYACAMVMGIQKYMGAYRFSARGNEAFYHSRFANPEEAEKALEKGVR